MNSKMHLSLRTRIFISFFAILLLMVCIYIFAIANLTRYTTKELNSDFENFLIESYDTVEKQLWNLTLTSQQLLDNEDISSYFLHYYNDDNIYSRQESYNSFVETFSSLTMPNADIALTYFYDESRGDILYTNLPADKRQRSLPVLYRNSTFCFQGPCQSQSGFIGNPVLILNRKETLENGDQIILSVESGYYSLDSLINSSKRKSAYLVFTNYEDELVYSTFPSDIGNSEILESISGSSGRKYRTFMKESSQGWHIYVVVPKSVYRQSYWFAIKSFILCTSLLALLVAVFSMFFWKSIYRPLQLFDRQLSHLLSDEELGNVHSSIPEYEQLFQKVSLLKKQIQETLQRVINQEKRNTKMQIEKLRAQINPHFLMNTLNTIHWTALMNDQQDIDRITQSLSHLLSYNLDKESSYTTLKNELAALREYISLQASRYRFRFDLTEPPDASDLNYPCPKFILQPLVENALSHGYREGMSICLSIQLTTDWVSVLLEDTGTGIEAGVLGQLKSLSVESMANPEDISAMTFGIGLNYVVQSMNNFYNGRYVFDIDSTKGKGTKITLRFPKLRGGGYDAEDIDH